MIRKNWINFNLIRIKYSTKTLLDRYMTHFCPETEVCPSCHRKGDCHIHAYYDRFVIDYVDGSSVCSTIRVTRVICSCGHTHAVLPDPVIPYASYSLLFILRVLTAYYRRTATIALLCKKFSITPGMLYRWIRLYKEHRREWQGLLTTVEQDTLSSLLTLYQLDPFSDFAASFIQKTGMSFLQSHKNPASCQRRFLPP
ncbi:MAG: transposase [Oribacterium sp.]|nr:transposase [Oribacterium sp.]